MRSNDRHTSIDSVVQMHLKRLEYGDKKKSSLRTQRKNLKRGPVKNATNDLFILIGIKKRNRRRARGTLLKCNDECSL